MERGVSRAAPDGARARAAELACRYDDLLAEADAAAVTWRWATPTSGFGDVEPLRLERMGCSPGRWLDGPPPGAEHEAIGFDALDRIAVVRELDSTGEVWLERFATWTAAAVEVACFRAPLDCGDRPLPAELQAVTVVQLAAGRPVESERFLPPTGSCTRARFRHVDGRLARVEEDATDVDGRLTTVVKEVVYGEDGRVIGVDRIVAGGREPVWRTAARNGAGPD